MADREKHLVQILVPMITGEGKALERKWFEALLAELTECFGGATSFKQSPGQGHWDSGNVVEKDSVALIEVVTVKLDSTYWQELKARLEEELSQDEIMIRALPVIQF